MQSRGGDPYSLLIFHVDCVVSQSSASYWCHMLSRDLSTQQP